MDEEDFVSVVVANARVQTWVDHILSPEQPARRLQALHALSEAIQTDATIADEAPRFHLPPQLTRMLATTDDEALMTAVASLLSALSGATVQKERVIGVTYPEIGELRVREAALDIGVGARLWGIAHRINTMLVQQRAVVADQRVLELGSGVGCTGVTLAKLGASHVVLSDVVPEVLHNLRRTMHLNAPDAKLDTNPPEAPLNGPTAAGDEFSDAETVSDEAELLDADGSGGPRGALNGQDDTDKAWRAGNMCIRLLDWKRELDLLGASTASGGAAIDETTSSLDGLRVHPADSAAPRESTFDEPGHCADLPPELPPLEAFPVIVGCEVLYELPHARWVAATIRRRLAPGGQAVVVGAVRDVQVYELFERCLRLHKLHFQWSKVTPLSKFPGTTLGNRESDYEGGFRMYVIDGDGQSVLAQRFKL